MVKESGPPMSDGFVRVVGAGDVSWEWLVGAGFVRGWSLSSCERLARQARERDAVNGGTGQFHQGHREPVGAGCSSEEGRAEVVLIIHRYTAGYSMKKRSSNDNFLNYVNIVRMT